MLEKVWQYLDGKKTIIGTVLLFASALTGEVLVGIWDIDHNWLPKVASTFAWFGMAMGGTGLIHKVFKQTREANEAE